MASLPYFKLCQALYFAEVQSLRDLQTAESWAAKYEAVLERASQLPIWAMFGSAQDSALRDDVKAVLTAFYINITARGESACNGYHPWGYLWHFSNNFAQTARGSDSKLFLFPGDWGSEFTGTRPEQISDPDYITPPHLSQTVRGPAMFMLGRRGAIFAPFGKGGKSELAQHRELMQIARWTCTPFTNWDVKCLPKRFLIDTRLNNGWFFDSEIQETGNMLVLPSLYPHDSETELEMIIRVTGTKRVNKEVTPHVYEFARPLDAATFIYEHGT